MFNPLASTISRNELSDFPSEAIHMKRVGNLSCTFFYDKTSQQCMHVSDHRDFKINGKDRNPVSLFVAILAI